MRAPRSRRRQGGGDERTARPRKRDPEVGGYSVAVEPDAETGWDIVVLRYVDPDAPRRGQVARLAPAAGSNLFSWKVDGAELLYQPAQLGQLTGRMAGTPIMFPTVNRVRDARMVFEGREFVFTPNSGNNFIHGLAGACRFDVVSARAHGRGARAETRLLWDTTQPDFARFPIKHQLTLGYELRKRSLVLDYRIDNLDEAKLPYAFGLHPFFRVPSQRDTVGLTVPLEERMEAVECLPTGSLVPVGGGYDLRDGAPLSRLELDDAYIGMTPAKAATITLEDFDLRLRLTGTDEFTHLVIYTPPHERYFCVENQTSSTDAHNLHARGKERASHLLVVAPGRHASGAVTWAFTRRA